MTDHDSHDTYMHKPGISAHRNASMSQRIPRPEDVSSSTAVSVFTADGGTDDSVPATDVTAATVGADALASTSEGAVNAGTPTVNADVPDVDTADAVAPKRYRPAHLKPGVALDNAWDDASDGATAATGATMRATAADAPTAQAQPNKRTGQILHTAAVIIGAVLLALFIRTFVAEVFIVPSGSMLQTIQLGDRLLGEKVSYRFTKPHKGDVVTFKSLEDASTILVKRVIATEGQTVDLIDGKVYVDGKPLDEPYTSGRESYPLNQSIVPGGITYPYKVSKDHVWVMGDNRTNSLDSRYFGAVPTQSITSRVLCIYWPLHDAMPL